MGIVWNLANDLGMQAQEVVNTKQPTIAVQVPLIVNIAAM